MKTLKVGYPGYWGSLVPALQHTSFADEILSNEFETLVKEAPGGRIFPGLAKSWEVNSDFTVYKFHLDTDRVFSDGSRLSAEVVKHAWEYGLKLNPKSANSSLQDVLYLVDGFSTFKETQSLSGLKVLDEATLEVSLTRPFRTALSEFSTGRMAIFIPKERGAVGTGPYIIQDHEKDNSTSLVRNPKFQGEVPFENVEVRMIEPDKAQKALDQGTIDLYAFASRATLKCDETNEMACWSGVESTHYLVYINGMNGRLFANKELRKALQYLVLAKVNINVLPTNFKNNLTIDPQPYLELQPGRLDSAQVKAIIEEGKSSVAKLAEASRKSPVYIISSENNRWLAELLEEAGVKIDLRSQRTDAKTRMNMYYKTYEPDLIIGNSSVSSGDPDGLFHVLAKDGAITSPMIYRLGVSAGLEAGRSILQIDKLDKHYKLVSEAVLREVPFVHIGFTHNTVVYNKKLLATRDVVPGRETGSFLNFKPK